MSYRLREMLSKIKVVGCQHVISWEAMNQLREDPERIAQHRAADMVSHLIAGDILQGGTWRRSKEPEGEFFSVKGYWLTYDELYRLLEDAYSLGRAEPIALTSASSPTVSAHQWSGP